MVQNLCQGWWKLRLVVVLALTSLTTTFTNAGFAQIVPDDTLGAQSSRLTNENVRGLPAVLIEGGATRGVNLFQSFLQFNVGDGQRVYFGNPAGIENILTRVTGSDPSNIFGTLGVNGGANLFFLNPNGIVFGPNARLDIAGSFLASTANSFVFENGLKFSATNPEAAPLITVNLRPGLQYGNQVGTVSNTGNLSAGQDLTLTGGNLDLQGTLQASRDLTLQATNTLKVRDSVANPFIVAAGGQLVVQGNQNVDIFALNHPDSGFFSGGDMVLRSANTVGGDAHYWAGGNFRIEQLDGSLGNLFSPDDPIIRASGDVSFASYTGASLHILAGGSVTISGLVEITGTDPNNGLTETVTLSDGTQLNIDGKNSLTLDIRAGTTAFGEPGLTPLSRFPREGNNIVNTNAPSTSADIKIGSIRTGGSLINQQVINGRVFLTNQYQPNTNLSGGSIEITDGVILPDARVLGSYSIFAVSSPVTIDARSDVTIAKGIISGSVGGFSGQDIQILGGGQDIKLLSGGTVQLKPGGVDGTSTIRGSLVSLFNGDSGNITVRAANNIIATGDITSQVVQLSVLNAGEITLKSNLGEIVITGLPVSFTNALSSFNNNNNTGRAGNVTLTAPKDIRVGNIGASSNSDNKGFSTISVESKEGSLFLDNSRLIITNSGADVAGDIIINALNDVKIENNSNISSKGNFGRIFIGSADLSPKTVTIDNSILNTDNPGLTGKAGDISINAINNISIANSSLFSGATNREGAANAGNIFIGASGAVSIADSSTIKSELLDGTGDAGKITINAGSISLTNESKLITDNNGFGLAGSIELLASNQNVSLENSQITSESNNDIIDKFPLIRLEATKGSVFLNQSKLSTTNFGSGWAGDIRINALNEVKVENNSNIGSKGNLGRIFISSAELSSKTVTIDNSQLNTDNNNISQPAGDIRIDAIDKVSIKNSNISSITNSGGKAGTVNIQSIQGSVAIDGSLITVETKGQGSGGDINIDTASLSLTNSSQLQAQTRGSGQAGNVFINNDDRTRNGLVSLDNSQIFSSIEPGGTGNGGNINITAGSLSLKNGAQLQTLVRQADAEKELPAGQGEAGKITLKVTDTLELDGARTLISSELQQGTQGKGGSIDIDPNLVNITNGAKIAVDSQGTGPAGDIILSANRLTLENQAAITANANSGNGGNITLNLRDLLQLQRNSQISTTSGVTGAGGNGGFITINAPNGLIFSPQGQNNDISANAFLGNGGQVNITAKGVFGLRFLSRQELESELGTTDPTQLNPQKLPSNDITPIFLNVSASVNSPDVEPSKSRLPLPANTSDPSKKITPGCKVGQFVNTGRGGLPARPDDSLSSDAVWEDLRQTATTAEQRSSTQAAGATPTKDNVVSIIPATAWVFNDKGEVTLISHTPVANSSPSWSNSSNCSAR